MDNKVYEIFNKIRAEKALKQKTADFLYEKIRQKGIGRKNTKYRLAVLWIFIVLMGMTGGFSYNLYFKPGAYVDIDINPSIELAVNRFGRVVEASSFNDDGAAVLKKAGVRHMGYEDAVDKLIGAMAESNYLKQDGMVSITVQTTSENRENSMLAGLQMIVFHALKKYETNADSQIFAVSRDVWSHAHQNGMTPAKYLAISKLQQVDSTATFEGCQKHTISEINRMIEARDGCHPGGETDGNESKDHGEKHYEKD